MVHSQDLTYGEPFDYYISTNESFLKSIEDFFENQAIRKIEEELFSHAWGDIALILHYYPNHPRALQLLSSIAMPSHKEEDCNILFERAIELYPEYPETLLIYGRHLHRQKRYEEAISQFKRVLELDPTVLDAHKDLFQVYSELEEYNLYQKHKNIYESRIKSY